MSKVLLQTKPQTASVVVLSVEEGETVTSTAQVSQNLLLETKQELSSLVGQLYLYLVTGTACLKQAMEHVAAQVELKEVTVEYNRAVEGGKDTKEINELQLQLQALASIQPPDMTALEAVKQEIITGLMRKLSTQSPYKADGNSLYAANDDLFGFADAAAEHNTGLYVSLTDWAKENSTSVQGMGGYEIADFRQETENDDEFVKTNIPPLHAFTAEIFQRISSLSSENLRELSLLASYLDGSYFEACELATKCIEKAI
jgi:hypothetical protein